MNSGLYYFIFLICYIISFYFIYQQYSEIIGLLVLFIVNAGFLLYVGQKLMYTLTNNGLFKNIMFSSVMIGIIFHFVSLILMGLMMSSLQLKFTAKFGTPIQLPDRNQAQLNKFKTNMLIIFSLGAVLLAICLNINIGDKLTPF